MAYEPKIVGWVANIVSDDLDGLTITTPAKQSNEKNWYNYTGAGPVGLFAVHQLGIKGLKSVVIDNLDKAETNVLSFIPTNQFTIFLLFQSVLEKN